MQIGRTSCSDFRTNTFRLVLTPSASTEPRYAWPQFSAVREQLLKLGTQVVIWCIVRFTNSQCHGRDASRIPQVISVSLRVIIGRIQPQRIG